MAIMVNNSKVKNIRLNKDEVRRIYYNNDVNPKLPYDKFETYYFRVFNNTLNNMILYPYVNDINFGRLRT